MTRMTLCSAVLACIAQSMALHAAPYCGAFLEPEAMPAQYARLAPVLSNTDTGWIFTQDQLREDYGLKPRNAVLLEQIAQAFERQGMQLAILMPPPRPLAAGQAVLDETAAGAPAIDVARTAKSFSEMTAQVRRMGILMPDLSLLALDRGAAAPFYFGRDTHWTPFGAALSARALAGAVLSGATLPAPVPGAGMYEERGSLSGMARKICGVELAPETAPFAVLPATGGGLLDPDGSGPRAVLAGSSFSDRYKRDAYRVADALSAYLGRPVENRSVSGGGAIGAIEGLVSSGMLRRGQYDLVIWELPYTESLNKESALRQLLGALVLAGGKLEVSAAVLTPGAPLKIPPGGPLPVLVRADSLPLGVQRHTVEIRYRDRKPTRIKLQRKDRVPSGMREGPWAVSLAELPSVDVQSISLMS